MKKLWSHFWYSRSQRNGIFILMTLIVVSQILYFSIEFTTQNHYSRVEDIAVIRGRLDSLSVLRKKKIEFKIKPFNPNFISDYKGYQLGMSIEEIDRLHQFRAQNHFVNSAKEFQKITKVPDSLLAKISPYFKFPDWVQSKKKPEISRHQKSSQIKGRTFQFSTTDLNLATAKDFNKIQSIDAPLANRIVNYRNKLQGFFFESQLKEVWQLGDEQVKEVLKVFSLQSKPVIKKVNINVANFKEVLAIPYVDYDLCKKLFAYRDEVAELQSISEIKNLKGFPLHLYDRIVLYLSAE